jgi:BlaI family penicillinase repressor
MGKSLHADLSRREREIMDAVYQLGEAGVAEIAQRMGDDPGYDSVRVTLGILEKKGHVAHREDGRRYVYQPTVPHSRATKTALRDVLKTFFGGSPSKAILTLLDMSAARLSPDELNQIAAWIEKEKASEEDSA